MGGALWVAAHITYLPSGTVYSDCHLCARYNSSVQFASLNLCTNHIRSIYCSIAEKSKHCKVSMMKRHVRNLNRGSLFPALTKTGEVMKGGERTLPWEEGNCFSVFLSLASAYSWFIHIFSKLTHRALYLSGMVLDTWNTLINKNTCRKWRVVNMDY